MFISGKTTALKTEAIYNIKKIRKLFMEYIIYKNIT